MNIEKVKEIKKALGCCRNSGKCGCKDCPYYNTRDCVEMLNWDMEDYINELESENERLKIVVDIANERTYCKKFIDEWRKEYQKELDKQGKGHIAGYPDFDLVYKLYFEQKDRIAELEKETAEKILKELYMHFSADNLCGIVNFNKHRNSAKVVSRLAKQFGVEIGDER